MTRPCAVFALACMLGAACAHAQVVPDGFAVQTLAQNLDQPVAIQFMPDGRILFAEQLTGRVRVYFEHVVGGDVLVRGVQANPVLQLSGVSVDGGERGLLGVALDPAFPARPYVYVHYTAVATATTPNRIRISRFTLSGNLTGDSDQDLVADTLSRYDLIDDIPDQAPNHNGGTVRFAADGYLYVSIGEDAQPCASQDTTQLRGKILRLQISTLPPGPGRAFRAQITPFDNPFASRPDSNARLVAALGLRNPFRAQPDRVRNWLVIGDPGENTREELDVLVLHLPTPRPAQPELGADFGWPFFEGSVPGPYANDCGPAPPNLAAPEFDYDRTSQLGGAAIIAAGAYWATGTGEYDFPTSYAGDLFANDYYSGTLYHLVPSGNGFAPGDVPGQPATGKWGTGFDGISDWALGRDGAFYFCRQAIGFAANSGVIGRIISTVTPPPAPVSLTIRLARSPAVNTARFELTLPGGSATLTILDLNGRRIRQTTYGGAIPGTAQIDWDGLDDDGRKAHPGLYLARIEAGGDEASVRVPFLR